MATISDDEEAVLARLDAAFAGQRAALSARQLAVVRAWQRTAREYELARSEIDLDRMALGGGICLLCAAAGGD